MITIKSTEADNSGILFKGYVSECTINTVKSSGVVNLKLISTSVKLDEEFEYESYQKEGDTFGSILKDTATKSKGNNSHCDSSLSSLKLEKPIIQYKETNWDFIKRIASRKRLPVIVDETADKPTFTIGYKKEGSASEKDFEKAGAVEFFRGKEYCERKFNEKNSKVSRKDYCGMELRSFKNLKIGNSVSVGGNSYIICSKQVKMKNAQLVFTYEAGTEKLYGLEPIYNEHLRGRCLEGKVVKTRDEYIKLQLELDEKKKPESELYEFKWKPETGNLMYTMPEENTVVSLYIGGSDEGDAIVINALRKDDGKDTNNPDDKYYTTAKGKRMYLKKEEAGFSNDAKDEGDNYVNIKDSEGVTFSSAQEIYVEAKGDIIIKSGNKLVLSGNKLFQAEQGSNALKIKGGIDPIGSKKKFDFGVATPDSTDEAKKVTLKNTETTVSGKPVADNPVLVKINEMFRGDQFKASNSFNASVPEELREDLIAVNLNSSCMLGESLDGSIPTNDKYVARYNDAEAEMRKKLEEVRASAEDITPNTVMQKAIDQKTLDGYLSGTYTTAGSCIAKAEDAAPFTNNPDDVYKNLRLDYKGSDYGNIAANPDGKVFVMRVTTTAGPDDISLPNRSNGNTPPCTETGFTGSDNCLIPEYYYKYSPITNGAIYEVDQDGNERMKAYWDGKKFQELE